MEPRPERPADTALSREEALLAPLLQQARDNVRAAFRRLVELCQARVYSAALRLTAQHADAEELAQDVFVQLHASLSRVVDAPHLQKWLLRAIYHRCIDRLMLRERQGQRLPLTLPRQEATMRRLAYFMMAALSGALASPVKWGAGVEDTATWASSTPPATPRR